MKGYTLIEILVGLTIIGLLFRVGYVNYRDFGRRQSLANFGKQLQGDLRLAQANSSTGIKPSSSLCNAPNILSGYSFDIAPASYQLLADCSGPSGGSVVVKTVEVPAELSITPPSVNPIKFKVLAQGNNIPAGQSLAILITQTATGATYTVTITSGGEIK